MRFRIAPLEERVVLDAAGVHELLSLDDIQDSHDRHHDGSHLGAEEPGLHVLVISSQVSQAEDLVKAARPGVKLVYYDARNTSTEALSRHIEEALEGQQAASIGFANHGEAGEFRLTSTLAVSQETLHESSMEQFWKKVSSFVQPGGRIDLLSCNLAESDEGLNLVHELEDLTGVNFAASTDLTANDPLGGDWILETDGIHASLIYFNTGLLESWNGTLAVPLANAYQAGQALSFDGVDDAVQVNHTDDLNMSGPFTAEAWIYVDEHTSEEKTLLQKGEQFHVLLKDGRIGLASANGSSFSDTAIEAGQWVHVSASYDGSQSHFTVNGQADGTSSSFAPASNNSDSLIIGQGFKGRLDEVRLWSQSRSSADVADDYTQVLQKDTSDLVGYWRFNSGSGNLALDYSGRAHHGLLQGNTPTSATIEIHSFDSSRQGWTSASDDGSEGVLYHFSSGGNSGGYLSTYDLSPEDKFWKAPAVFTGDLQSAFDGMLSFDLKQSETAHSLANTEDVILRGDAYTLTLDIADPGLTWTTYSLDLNASAGWKIQGSQESATDAIVRDVLSTLNSLEIRAEYQDAFVISDLDNVRVSAPSSDSAAWIHSTAPLQDTLSTEEDSDLIVVLGGIDADGDALSAKITRLPHKGQLLQFDGTAIDTVDTLVTDAQGRVIFRPAANESASPYATFGFVVNDGSEDSAESHATLVVTPVNDAPFAFVHETLTLDEGGTAVLDTTVLQFVDDEDSAFLTTYTVESLPTHGSLKRLGVPLAEGSTFTQADLDRDRVSFVHDDSESTSDQFTFTVKDSQGLVSQVLNFHLNFNRINDVAPEAGGDTTVSHPLGGALGLHEDDPSPESANIRLSVPNLTDADQVTPHQIRILSVTGGTLEQTDGAAIAFGEDGSLLNLVAGAYDFRFTPDAERENSASIHYVVVDPDDAAWHSEASVATVPILGVNDAPVLTSTFHSSPLPYTENGGMLAVDKSLSLSDSDALPQADAVGREIQGAAISIASGYVAGQDRLFFSETDEIQGSFDASTGVLTLTGTASTEAYQAALRTVSYWNGSENPLTQTRTVRFSVDDGSEVSNTIERQLQLIAVDDDPLAIDQGPGSALRFDGHNDHALVEGLDLADTSFSLSVWAQRMDATGSEQTLFSQGSNSALEGLRLGFLPDGRLQASFYDGGLSASEATELGAWHYYTLTFDASTHARSLYVDGQLVASDSASGPYTGSGPAFVGKLAWGTENFDGAIDELRVFSQVLSEGEIQASMTERLAGDETGLLGYWRFDEAKGGMSQDLSGHGHHAQLGGSPYLYQALATSTFENGDEGWSVTLSGGLSTAPTYQADDGSLSLVDPDASWSYWKAPDKFLGDQSAAYGGVLHYTLRNLGPGETLQQPDLILEGNGLRLSYQADQAPSQSEWTPFDISLHESAGWVDDATGEAATRAQLQSVLADLDSLKIRAEHLSGTETFQLKEVLLASTDQPRWVDSDAGITRVITVNEDSDVTVPLAGSDVEMSPLQAKMTRLANLFQFTSGFRGLPVTDGSPLISDPLLRVVFGAGSSGSTSFGFRVTDDQGVSPVFSNEANVDVNVIAINEAPTIHFPSTTPAVVEDNATPLTGITLGDPDAHETPEGKLTVELSVAHGSLSLNSQDSLVFLSGDGTGDRSMRFRGTLDALNSAIGSLVYVSDPNYVGAETLSITLNDEGNTGEGGALETSESLAFSVAPDNDAPVLSAPDSYTALEDEETPLSGISVADLDVIDPEDPSALLQVTLQVSHGTLAIAGGNRSQTLVLTDTLAQLNQELASLNYLSDAHYHGSDALSLSVSDQGNSGEGGALMDHKTLALFVEPTNDAPSIDLPPTQNATEDVNALLPPITLGDALDVQGDDYALYEVQLALDHGVLTLHQTAGLNFSEGSGVADKTMTFKGTLPEINQALSSTLYRADAHYHGSDQLQVTINDLGFEGQGNALSRSEALSIEVAPVDDPYTINAPSALAIEEGATLAITGISINDVDLSIPVPIDPSTVNLDVVVSVDNGSLSTNGSDFASSLSLSGTLQNVNDTLAALSYRGLDDFKGSDHLAIEVLDGSDVIASNHVFLTVDAVNDAPVFTVPSDVQVGDEEADIAISGFAITDIDVDEAINPKFRVTASVSHGSLTLNQASGLAFEEGQENGSATLAFTGSPEDVNAAIATITYRGDLNFNGSDQLLLSVSDLGNAGLGGPKTDSQTVAIQVNPVNDAPVLSGQASRSTYEDQPLHFSDLQISDVDIEETPDARVTVSLSSSHGDIHLGVTEGLALEAGSYDSHNLVFSASLDAANAALATLSYHSDPNYNGSDTLSFSVNDRGYTSAPDSQGELDSTGAEGAALNIAIDVQAVNDAPVLATPTSQSVFEDSPTTLLNLHVSDVDLHENPGALLYATLEVTYGSLTLTDSTGVDLLEGDGQLDQRLQLRGSLAAVEQALQNLEYTSALHHHSLGNEQVDTLTITLHDDGNSGVVLDDQGQVLSSNLLEVSTGVEIPILPINDPPTLEVPGAQDLQEDQELFLHFSLDDRDLVMTPDMELEVQLSVTHGHLTLASSSGLDFSEGSGSEDRQMTFRGTVPQINAALDALGYHPDEHYHGPDAVMIQVSDLGNTGQGDILTVSEQVDLEVHPVNDQPVIQVPATQSPTEDTSYPLYGLSLHDADVRMDPTIEVEVTLSVSHGILRLSDTSGLEAEKIAGDGSETLILQGTVPALNAALDGMTYQSHLHYHGDDLLSIDVDDLGNISGDPLTALQAHQELALVVIPDNDAPVLQAPVETQVLPEDSEIPISGLSLDDRDVTLRPDMLLEVTLSVQHGSVRIGDSSGLSFSEGSGAGAKTLRFTSTLPQLNSALGSVFYRGDSHFHGQDSLSITVDDLGNIQPDGETGSLQDARTVGIEVTPVNDAPVWQVPASLQSVEEDQNLVISGISFSDHDITMQGDIPFEVTLSVSHGRLTLASTQGLSFTSGDNGEAAMSFQGTLSQINAALNDLVYRGDPNYHDSDRLELHVSDLGNISPVDANGDPIEVLEANAQVELLVTPVNDAPLWQAPASIQVVNEDSLLTLYGIDLVDADSLRAPELPLEVSLSVSHGQLSLAQTDGLSFTQGDGSDDRALTFQGSLPDLKAALAELRYLPDADYHDEDSLVLQVSDLGNISPLDDQGQPTQILQDSHTVPLAVVPINDAPVWRDVPASAQVDEDHDLWIETIQLDDPDLLRRPDFKLQVALEASHGLLSLEQSDGLVFDSGDGSDDRHMIFRGTVTQLNDALARLKYRPDEHYHGADTIELTVNDLGNVHATQDSQWTTATGVSVNDLAADDPARTAESLVDHRSIAVTVDPVNDAPTLAVPPSQTVREDSDLVLYDFHIDDRDVTLRPDIQLELTLETSHGTLNLHPSADLGALTFLVGTGSDDPSLVVRGTVDQLNAALESVTYRGDSHYHGPDQILVRVDDLGNFGQILPPVEGVVSLTIEDSDGIEVEAINDPATIELPDSPQLAEEDTPYAIQGLVIGDPDTTVLPDIEVAVTLRVQHGTLTFDLLTLNQDPDFSISLVQGTGSGDKLVTLQGTIPSLNQALATLSYLGDPDYNQNHPSTPDILNIEVNDLGNVGSVHFPEGVPDGVTVLTDQSLLTTAHLEVAVRAWNDSPVISTPSFVQAVEDEVVAFEGIQVQDVDVNEAPDSEMELRLDVFFGTLSLRPEDLSQVTLSTGTGSGDKTIVLRGSLEALNQALAGLTYVGDLNYNSNTDGNDLLYLRVDDLGNVGEGGNKIAEAFTEIAIEAVNDQPTAVNIHSSTEADTELPGYTIIARLDTEDVDLEDVNLHQYTLVEEALTEHPEQAQYAIRGNNLFIANQALLNFADNPLQQVQVRSTDPGGLSKEQAFLITDRPASQETLDSLGDEVQLFENQNIAQASKQLRAVISLQDWSNTYDDLTATEQSSDTGSDDLGFDGFGDPSEEVVEENPVEDPVVVFSDFIKERSQIRGLSGLLKRFF